MREAKSQQNLGSHWQTRRLQQQFLHCYGGNDAFGNAGYGTARVREERFGMATSGVNASDKYFRSESR